MNTRQEALCNSCENDAGTHCDKNMTGFPWRHSCTDYKLEVPPPAHPKAPSGITSVYSATDKTKLIRYSELP